MIRRRARGSTITLQESFFDHRNDQSLLRLKRQLQGDSYFKQAQILSKTKRIRFFVDDFEKFMSVIWMIMLYPYVHLYSVEQRYEITEYVFRHFYEKRKPLIQCQDHLVLYRGLDMKGIL